MNNIQLSICIPTYNREKYLKEAIESITCQLDDSLVDKVEICISDNASTDNTKQLIENFQNQYKNITYFRQSQNMGADYNYLKVVEIAHGKYCWFLSSDDAIINGAIKKILLEIEMNSQIDIFCVNNFCCDNNLRNPKIAKHSLRNINSDIIFNNYSYCMKKMADCFGYISVFVFNKIKWDLYAKRKKFIGSAYSHTYILYSIMKNKGILKYIVKPLILYRSGNDSFATPINPIKRTLLDIEGYHNIAIDVFGKKSKEAKYIDKIVLSNTILLGFIYGILNDKITSKYRFILLKTLFRNYNNYFIICFKFIPLAFMPKLLVKIIRWIYKKLLERNYNYK